MQLNRTKFLVGTAALLGLASLAACIPPSPQPTPAPTPTPVATTPVVQPTQAAAPVAAPAPVNWADAPATPGDWTFGTLGGSAIATFGAAGQNPVFAMQCNRSTRTVSLGRLSNANNARMMRVLTETASRDIRAEPQAGSRASILSADVPAIDPFLDAMAFSKGRFAVQITGEPTLYIPAWPEVTRVIEECRR